MRTTFTVDAIVRYQNTFLALQRAENRSFSGYWNGVTGHVADYESAEDAALRELKEETGLSGTVIQTAYPFIEDIDDKRLIVVPVLVEVTDVSTLKIDATETQAYKWITPRDEVVSLSESHFMKTAFEKLGLL